MLKQANAEDKHNKNKNKDTDNGADKGVNKGTFKTVKNVNKGLLSNEKEEIIKEKTLKNLLYKPSTVGKNDLDKAGKG